MILVVNEAGIPIAVEHACRRLGVSRTSVVVVDAAFNSITEELEGRRFHHVVIDCTDRMFAMRLAKRILRQFSKQSVFLVASACADQDQFPTLVIVPNLDHAIMGAVSC